jgi:hypothetical protein
LKARNAGPDRRKVLNDVAEAGDNLVDLEVGRGEDQHGACPRAGNHTYNPGLRREPVFDRVSETFRAVQRRDLESSALRKAVNDGNAVGEGT